MAYRCACGTFIKQPTHDPASAFCRPCWALARFEEVSGKLDSELAKKQDRGAKGGTARGLKLSPERRKEIASIAARARWASKDAAE